MRKFSVLLVLFWSLAAGAALAQDDRVPREAAFAIAQQLLGTRPSNWSYSIGLPTDDATLGCPLVAAGKLDRQVVPYRYELTYASGIYVVYVSGDGGLVIPCDAKFNAPTAVPTATAVGAPTATPTPIGTPASVTAPNAAATLSANIAQTLRQYACPAGFAGYLTPRIRVGRATAAVERGGTPNRLRPLPIADNALAPQIGQIQPGRTIDSVLNGPACSGSFVWWYVEVDGVRGWTVESDAASSDYFIEPTPGNAATPLPPALNSSQAGVASVMMNLPQGGQLASLEPGLSFAWFSAFRGDSQALYGYTYDFPPATGGTLVEYDANTFARTGRVLYDPSFAVAEFEVSRLGDLVVAYSDRSVAVYNPDSLTTDPSILVAPTLRIPNAFSEVGSNDVLALSSDGRQMAIFFCGTLSTTAPVCDQLFVSLYNLGNGQLIRQLPMPANTSINRMAFSPDGATLYVLLGRLRVGAQQGVLAFNTSTGQQVSSFSNGAEQQFMIDMAVNPTTGDIFTTRCKTPDVVCPQGEVTRWTSSGAATGVLDSMNDSPIIIAFSPDGANFAVADPKGNVTVYDANGGPLASLQGSNLTIGPPPPNAPSDVYNMYDLVFSPDGRSLALVSSRNQVHVWRWR